MLERRLQWVVIAAAILTVPAIIIDASSVSPTVAAAGATLNWLTWVAFAAEAAIMTARTPGLLWLRQHPLELAVVLLTPPLLPAGLQAARAFRVLRLLRLVRAAALFRRMASTEGVRDAAVIAAVVVIGGGAAFSVVERGHHEQALSVWDGVWWAVTTVTTVGYGDLSPQTTAGRSIAIVVMLAGIGLVAVFTAAAAERFIRARREPDRGIDELTAAVNRLADRVEALEARIDPPR